MSNKGYEAIATGNEDDDKDYYHPTTSTNFLSLLTFWWMNNVFKIGSKRPLKQSDLLPLHEENRTRDLTERLQKEWNGHVQECNMAEAKQPKLWKCVLKTNRSLAYACCGFLTLSGLTSACTHYSAYSCELLGMRLSSAIKGIVYLKIPLISQQSLLETTTGNVIDLISNDVQRMELAPRWICTAILPVFEFITVVFLLLFFVGWQAVMGILFLLMVIPCVLIISGLCAQLRQETAEVTDRRISLMNELVTGIRALKAHAWEENYQDKVQEVR
ncbi:ATP-binding cassette subfamily C member 4-like, partial [Oculina patagonica]